MPAISVMELARYSTTISVAVQIADTDDEHIQKALQQAYETGELRGRKLLVAKKLVESRRR